MKHRYPCFLLTYYTFFHFAASPLSRSPAGCDEILYLSDSPPGVKRSLARRSCYYRYFVKVGDRALGSLGDRLLVLGEFPIFIIIDLGQDFS
ncbi:MAG: hypothetical protein AB4352_15525 [Hormoscilla sp.]